MAPRRAWGSPRSTLAHAFTLAFAAGAFLAVTVSGVRSVVMSDAIGATMTVEADASTDAATVDASASMRQHDTPSSSDTVPEGAGAGGRDSVDPNRVATFLAWLRKNGVDTSSFTVADRGSAGLGLIATREIRNGQEVLRIPRHLAMTPASAEADPVLSEMLSGLPGDLRQNDHVRLAVLLFHEAFYAEDSAWKPYLQLLPTDYGAFPMNWEGADKKLLQLVGPLQAGVALNNEYIAKQLDVISANVLTRYPEVFGEEKTSRERWARQYKWVYQTMRARMFAEQFAGEELAFVPGPDLMNHRRGAHRLSYENFTSAELAELGTPPGPARLKDFVRYADRDYAPGDELMLSYSGDGVPKCGYDMLLYYGFLPGTDGPEGKCAELTISVGRETVLQRLRWELYSQLPDVEMHGNATDRGQFRFTLRAVEGPPLNAFRFARATNMVMQDFDKHGIHDLVAGRVVSLMSELSAARQLITMINLLLESTESTRHEAIELGILPADPAEYTQNARMIMTLWHDQRRALMSTLEGVRNVWMSLLSNDYAEVPGLRRR